MILAAFLLGSALILDRDAFALESSVGRITAFDVVLGLAFAVSLGRGLVGSPGPLENSRSVTPRRLIVGGLLTLGGAGMMSILVVGTFSPFETLAEALGDTSRFVGFSILTLILTATVQRSRQNLDTYRRFWIWGATAVYAVCLGQVLAILGVGPLRDLLLWENVRGSGSRIAGTLRWQGVLVMLVGITLPLIVAEIRVTTERHRSVYFASLAIIACVTLAFTGSRSSLLVLPLALVPAIVGLKGRAARTMIVVLAVGVAGLVVFNSHEVRAISRVSNIATDVRSLQSESRTLLWSEGLARWRESPLFGVGPDQLRAEIGRSAHSSYLSVLIEKGMVGLVPLIIMKLGLLLLAYRLWTSGRSSSERIRNTALAVGVLNVLVYGLVATAITYRMVWLFIPLALAQLHVVEREERSESMLSPAPTSASVRSTRQAVGTGIES